jgi:ankyrin repeat protein
VAIAVKPAFDHGLRTMHPTDVFSELESDICWGPSKPARQTKILQALQINPALATDEDEFGHTLLMYAAQAANLEVVSHLCRLGANTQALASTGDTPLICAVGGADNEPPEADTTEARAAIIETLIQFGANPDQLGWQGCSALHYAVIYGRVALVRQLLLGGADPTVRLSDPPSDENAIELAESGRFYGSEAQRLAIKGLLAR